MANRADRRSIAKRQAAVQQRTPDRPEPQSAILQSVQVHSGPLPSPDSLAQYEQVLPGSADRIVTMAEEQADHRRRQESWWVKTDSFLSFLGLILTFVALMAFLGVGAWLIVSGYSKSGLMVIGTPLVTIAFAFSYAVQMRRKK